MSFISDLFHRKSPQELGQELLEETRKANPNPRKIKKLIALGADTGKKDAAGLTPASRHLKVRIKDSAAQAFHRAERKRKQKEKAIRRREQERPSVVLQEDIVVFPLRLKEKPKSEIPVP